MELISVKPSIIYGFMPWATPSRALIQAIRNRVDSAIKPIPIFKIPLEHQAENYEYILADGNHRRNARIILGGDINCALYEPTETIDVARDGIAPFRYSNRPRIFETLLQAFLLRDILPRP